MLTQGPKKMLVLLAILLFVIAPMGSVAAATGISKPNHCKAMALPMLGNGTFCTTTSMTASPPSAPAPKMIIGEAFIVTTCGQWKNVVGVVIWTECLTGAWSSNLVRGVIYYYKPAVWSKDYILASWQSRYEGKSTNPQLPSEVDFGLDVGIYYWLPWPFQEWNYAGTVDCHIYGYVTYYDAGCTFG